MDGISLKLEEIKVKANSLHKMLVLALEENKALKLEMNLLREEVNLQNEKVGELEKKNLNLHLTKNNNAEQEETDKTVLKQKLDEYIRSIDECLTRLKG